MMLPDKPRETLRSSPSGNETQRSPAMPEDCAARRNPLSTRQRKIKTTAHAVPIDGREYRSREVFHRTHESLTHFRELISPRAVQRRDFGQIRTGRKESFIPRNYQGTPLARQVLDRSDEGQHTFPREAVCSVLRTK